MANESLHERELPSLDAPACPLQPQAPAKLATWGQHQAYANEPITVSVTNPQVVLAAPSPAATDTLPPCSSEPKEVALSKDKEQQTSLPPRQLVLPEPEQRPLIEDEVPAAELARRRAAAQ